MKKTILILISLFISFLICTSYIYDDLDAKIDHVAMINKDQSKIDLASSLMTMTTLVQAQPPTLEDRLKSIEEFNIAMNSRVKTVEKLQKDLEDQFKLSAPPFVRVVRLPNGKTAYIKKDNTVVEDLS